MDEYAKWYLSTSPEHQHSWLPVGEEREYILFSAGGGVGLSPYIYPIFFVSEEEQKEFLQGATATEITLFNADLMTNQAKAVDLILKNRTPPASVQGLLNERFRLDSP